MKTNYYKFKNTSKAVLALCLIFTVLFSACKKDKVDDPAFFELKDNPTSLKASSEGATQSYTIKSNRSWKIATSNQVDWVNIEPIEGKGDGTFKVTVNANTTSDARTVNLTFSVDGKQQSNQLKVEQEGKEEEVLPHFELKDNPTGLEVSADGGASTYTVESNSAWIIDPQVKVDWVAIAPAQGNGNGTFTITVSKNTSTDARTVNLAFLVNGKQEADLFKIDQEGVEVPVEDKIIFSEDFSWLDYGNTGFSITGGEKRMDQWTPEELGKGWTSTPHPGSSGQFLVYARPGFVKLGKTALSGDFISPKLSGVTGTQDLTVKFKAVPYKSKTGIQDANILRINIIGPGTISTGEFIIDNWPDYTGVTDEVCPNCTVIWQASETERSFTITGATAETQIRFVGDDLTPARTNRVFLDDIIVTVKK